jgi:hypothetical protein
MNLHEITRMCLHSAQTMIIYFFVQNSSKIGFEMFKYRTTQKRRNFFFSHKII